MLAIRTRLLKCWPKKKVDVVSNETQEPRSGGFFNCFRSSTKKTQTPVVVAKPKETTTTADTSCWPFARVSKTDSPDTVKQQIPPPSPPGQQPLKQLRNYLCPCFKSTVSPEQEPKTPGKRRLRLRGNEGEVDEERVRHCGGKRRLRLRGGEGETGDEMRVPVSLCSRKRLRGGEGEEEDDVKIWNINVPGPSRPVEPIDSGKGVKWKADKAREKTSKKPPEKKEPPPFAWLLNQSARDAYVTYRSNPPLPSFDDLRNDPSLAEQSASTKDFDTNRPMTTQSTRIFLRKQPEILHGLANSTGTPRIIPGTRAPGVFLKSATARPPPIVGLGDQSLEDPTKRSGTAASHKGLPPRPRDGVSVKSAIARAQPKLDDEEISPQQKRNEKVKYRSRETTMQLTDTVHKHTELKH